MEFKVRKKTFLKSKDNTTNIMYSILVILVLFILFATYKNGIYPTIKGYGSLYLLFMPLSLHDPSLSDSQCDTVTM